MVELGDALPFKSVLGVPLVGLSVGHRDESVVSTNEYGVISLYDVPTRLVVLSWKLTGSDTITVPVSYITTAGLYTAIRNNSELIYWEPSVTFATDFKVLQLSHTVHSLLPTPSGTSITVVYTNNTIEVLNIEDRVISQNKRKKKTAKASCTSVEHSLFVTPHNTPTHLIVINKTDDGQYSAILYLLTEKNALKELGTIPIGNGDNGELCSITSTTLSLYMTWSIGHVQKVNLNDIIDKLECNLQLLTELGTPTSLTCISDSFVITLSEQCIKVYESKYHTLQASIVVQDSIKQLSQCYHGYLFLFGSSGALIGCSMFINEFTPSLANALGKGDGLLTKLCVDEGGVASSKLAEKIKRFLSPATSHNEKYKTCKNEFVTGCDAGSAPITWHRKELLDIIKAGIYPISLSSILYSKALSSSDWPLIFESMEYVNCVPENIMVQILDSLLCLSDDFSLEINNETFLKDQLLWKVLSLPKNDVLLLKPLAKLSQTSVIALVDLLSQHIDECFFTVSTTDQWCQFEDAIDWISLILDTHFTRLILVPSVHVQLLKLRNTVWKQMRMITNLSLLGAVDYAIKTADARTSHSNWLYKLDRLELDF